MGTKYAENCKSQLVREKKPCNTRVMTTIQKTRTTTHNMFEIFHENKQYMRVRLMMMMMMIMMMMMMTTRTKMSQSFLLYVLSKICPFSDGNSAQVSNIFMIIHTYVYTYPGSEKHKTFPPW